MRLSALPIFLAFLVLAGWAAAAVGNAAPAEPPPISERNVVFLDYPGFPEAHSSWGAIG